ncbi:hypothetical protein SAMN04488057_11113 [Cyclobacterium lianum]|uniref:N-acetyltransferase domain-containing protein n=1 Tax=Cyclobacterium lianum TaxID=388280 RepID=A0A1M7PVF9_9BACT|nr:hypothetical protein [Cyclobacterium lianum]SHN21529.1 hypothetical protein SAMN04488057_11113 [Cyclobacterium lianum]
MQLQEVSTKAQQAEFVEMAARLYRNEENWIRPLDKDIEDLFHPETNKLFKTGGKAIRWLLLDDEGNTIGRNAAFINPKWKEKQPTGGMGFFECINDQKAAFMLFDAARDWLKAQGMEAMDGPVNFGERDKWWGLLVDGYAPPNYNMYWNFPYYRELFEAYGFQVYFRQYTYMRPVRGVTLDPKMEERARTILQDEDFQFRYLKGKELWEKFPEYFMKVYNKAWARHMGKTISEREARLMLTKMKPVIDPYLVYFGFYKGEPVSFFINIPEINQLFKYVNGRLDLMGKLKFLWNRTFNPPNKMLGLVFGVVPEFQGKGVESAMITEYRDNIAEKKLSYKTIEMNWIGDFNPKMMRVCEQLNASIYKTHHTYRYLFDREKPFERHPVFK